MNRLLRSSILLTTSLFVASSVASAQSIWGTNGPTAFLGNQAGPPSGPCSYPNGPFLGGFPSVAPFGCGVANTYPGALTGVYPAGDVAVDRIADTVWATDGIRVTNYAKNGAVLASFVNPFPVPLTGLGWSAPFGLMPRLLWLTDGRLYGAIALPQAGCPVPPLFLGPFSAVLTTTASVMTDIDFDPSSGTLFFSDSAGFVSNQFIGGGIAGFGIFAPAVTCLLPTLEGLAVDTASCNALFVTDSLTVARINFLGNPAAPTFYAPQTCSPWIAGGPTSGLAFDATPITFGKGSDPAGSIPTIGTIGEALSPNPGFGLTLGNATSGGQAFLLMSVSSACPVVPVGFGAFIHVFPINSITGPFPIPASGGFAMPAPIPAGFACSGLTAYLEWLVVKPAGGGLETSPGLHVRPAQP
ncbi:MAG: hypothetical protein IPH13_05210 [Planctomycetes bacterium]|nr:hypothetical protein [Planctomycetota bacterium]